MGVRAPVFVCMVWVTGFGPQTGDVIACWLPSSAHRLNFMTFSGSPCTAQCFERVALHRVF